MQDAGYGLRRIPLPRTWVNKSLKQGLTVIIHRPLIALLLYIVRIPGTDPNRFAVRG